MRVSSALKWALCNLETESVTADLRTLSKEDLKKVVEPLAFESNLILSIRGWREGVKPCTII